MKSNYTADIGLEVHAELQTKSKMFCACPVVDLTQTPPNTAACPICAGMPGTLPTVNAQAVVMALRVALALECEVHPTSQFARKNYFYPDLPKGYQISQYEFPLAEHGALPIRTDQGWINVRIRRVHLEEDTAKLTHIHTADGDACSLVDLNRAGIPLLEIVSEPDMHTVDQVYAYTRALRTLLQYLEVNSGDLEKGLIRFEANVSVRPTINEKLGTRVEIKNLNSFHTMTAAITYELERQTALLRSGDQVAQETLGWDEVKQITFSQRSKEEAHDYRYYPEPDLPPLTLSKAQITAALLDLPERPDRRFRRYMQDLGLEPTPAETLIKEKRVADYYEATLTNMQEPDPRLAANWILGDLFGLMNASGQRIDEIQVSPGALASLLDFFNQGKINATTAKSVLSQIFDSGKSPTEVIKNAGLEQLTDRRALAEVVAAVLAGHPEEVVAYRNGKTALMGWIFGQVMQQTGGQANPTVVQDLLDEML